VQDKCWYGTRTSTSVPPAAPFLTPICVALPIHPRDKGDAPTVKARQAMLAAACTWFSSRLWRDHREAFVEGILPSIRLSSSWGSIHDSDNNHALERHD